MIRRVFLILGANLFLLAVGILFLEFFFGNWRGTLGMERLNVPHDVKIVKDNSRLKSSKSDLIVYARDSNGLRGPFTDLSKVQLLTLGGSTTDQSDLSDGETWQDVLAAEFRKAGKEVQIANAGIDGQSVFAHSRSLRTWLQLIPQLKPKYVSAYVGINDLCYDPEMYRPYFLDEDSFKSLIARRSALYYLYRTLRGIILRENNPLLPPEPQATAMEMTHQPLFTSYEGLFDYALNAYETRLLRLIRRIKKFNPEATPILITQKVHYFRDAEGRILGDSEVFGCWGQSVNGVDAYHIMNLLNERTLKVCRENNGICIDLAKELDFELEDFYDLEHNSWKGSEKIGQYLYQKLKGLF